jgi:hypothetical protein
VSGVAPASLGRKRCDEALGGCGQDKDIEAFRVATKSLDGRAAVCKDCRSAATEQKERERGERSLHKADVAIGSSSAHLRPVGAAPKLTLGRGCREADITVAREVFGEEVESWAGKAFTSGMSTASADADWYWASGPNKGSRVPDYTTSYAAMWLVRNRIRDLGLSEEWADWMGMVLHGAHQEAAHGPWRGDRYELLFGPLPAPLVFCSAALDVLRARKGVDTAG